MKPIKIIVYTLFIMLLISSIVLFYRSKVLNVNINKLQEIRYKNLMIVAHPDDELLWGGAHLIKDDYVVVCITCGENEKRLMEFMQVMKRTNDQYIFLGYPDKVRNRRDDWKKSMKSIKKDLKKILDYQNWDMVVTHNRDGEYGHIQHKMTNRIVTSVYDKDNLYCFGKYYARLELPKDMNKIDQDLYKKKSEIMKLYFTQKNTTLKFKHMWSYENFEKCR